MTKNPFLKATMNLTEQGKLYRENRDMYNQLKAEAEKHEAEMNIKLQDRQQVWALLSKLYPNRRAEVEKLRKSWDAPST